MLWRFWRRPMNDSRGLVEVVVHYYKLGDKIYGPVDAHMLWLKNIDDTTVEDKVQDEGAEWTRFVFTEDNVGIDLIVTGSNNGSWSCSMECEIENTSIYYMFEGYSEEFVKIADAIKEIFQRPQPNLPNLTPVNFSRPLQELAQQRQQMDKHSHPMDEPIRFIAIISHADGGWEYPEDSYSNLEGLLNLNNDPAVKEAGDKLGHKVFGLEKS